MDFTGLVIFLVIGAVAGWLAGSIMKGGGFGLPGNILIGIAGGIVGGFMFRLLVIARRWSHRLHGDSYRGSRRAVVCNRTFQES